MQLSGNQLPFTFVRRHLTLKFCDNVIHLNRFSIQIFYFRLLQKISQIRNICSHSRNLFCQYSITRTQLSAWSCPILLGFLHIHRTQVLQSKHNKALSPTTCSYRYSYGMYMHVLMSRSDKLCMRIVKDVLSFFPDILTSEVKDFLKK